MRLKLHKTIGLFVVLINIIVVYYLWRIFIVFPQNIDTTVKEPTTKSITKHISKLVTVVLADFELYENDVSATINSFVSVLPNIHVLVLCESLPYPPLEIIESPNITHRNVKIINSRRDLNSSYIDHYLLNHVQTKYVLFVPDSTRLPNKQILQFVTNEMSRETNIILAIPVSHADLTCFNVTYNLRQWSLNYSTIKGNKCDAVEGKHLIIIETTILMKLPDIQLLPMPLSLYLQTSFLNYTVVPFELL